MKQKILIGSVVGLMLLGGAVGVGAFNDKENTKQISMEKAKEIAVNEVNGNVEKIKLEKDDGKEKYEVELREPNKNDDTEIEVDVNSGKVIKVDRDDDHDDDINDLDDNDNDSDDNVVNVNNTNNSPANSNLKAKISKEEAITIATKETPGKVVDVELDDNHYEIEIKDGNKEIDYKIDANTGKIIEKDVDTDDGDDIVNNTNSSYANNNQKVKLSKEEAIAIATKDTPGKVIAIELDDNHYEIEIKDGIKEIEYKINTHTGKIIEKDVDTDDGDDD